MYKQALSSLIGSYVTSATKGELGFEANAAGFVTSEFLRVILDEALARWNVSWLEAWKKPGPGSEELFDAYVGFKVSAATKEKFDAGAAAARKIRSNFRRSDFLRLLLEDGLRRWQVSHGTRGARMIAPLAMRKKQAGPRPKDKTLVLGVPISLCLTRGMEADVLREAALSGETRPEAMRSLMQDGLNARRAQRSTFGIAPDRDAPWAAPSFTSAADNPAAKRGA